jgi:hypothetical protein
MVLGVASRLTVALHEAENTVVGQIAVNRWGMVGGTNELPNG